MHPGTPKLGALVTKLGSSGCVGSPIPHWPRLEDKVRRQGLS